jgi:hypothetical protein
MGAIALTLESRRSVGQSSSAHRSPKHPRRELRTAEIKRLALGRLARGHLQHQIEDARSALLHGLVAIKNGAAIDVRVVFHAPIHRRVGREFDRGRGLAVEHAAAAGGEADQVGAAGHLPGCRHRVVARLVTVTVHYCKFT